MLRRRQGDGLAIEALDVMLRMEVDLGRSRTYVVPRAVFHQLRRDGVLHRLRKVPQVQVVPCDRVADDRFYVIRTTEDASGGACGCQETCPRHAGDGGADGPLSTD